MEWSLLWLLLLSGVLCELPQDLSVDSYDLKLNVSSDLSSHVNGSVDITFRCTKNTSTILLHWGSSLLPTPAKSNFSVRYTFPNSSDIPVSVNETVFNSKTDQVTISTTEELVEGEGALVTVSASFQTTINEDNKGLFYRTYSTQNNQTNTMLLTNLWPTFARELFPCQDDPQGSARVQLTLTYPDSWSVGATVAADSSTSGSNIAVFKTSNIPPSNFGLFLAPNMKSISKISNLNTRLTFWSRQGLANSTFTANAHFLLDYYNLVEEVVSIALPTEQLNVVMVPGLEEPYSAYGVIFIREDYYVQDFSNPLWEGWFKINVAPVVYQFIRQFCEFSTRPASWNDYWTSQAVAKYLQFVTLNTAVPLFDFATDLEVVARQTALSLDSQVDARPLRESSPVDTNSTASIQALLNDPLKSIKGAAILNMLDHSLPAGSVYSAITSLLSNKRNASITSDEFLNTMQSDLKQRTPSTDAKIALTSTFHFWFDTTKYPLETVKVVSYTTNSAGGTVSLTTSAFCLATGNCTSDLPGTFYLAATVGSKSDNRYYTLRQNLWANNVAVNNTVSTYIIVKPNDWVVANMRSGGYYRSNYDADNWEHITFALLSNDQLLFGRSQLLDDAFALASSSVDALNLNVTLRLALANLGNNMYRDWVPVQRGLQSLKDQLLSLNQYSVYKKFAAGYYLKLNQDLQSWNIDAFEKARIQTLFLDDMCENDIVGYRATAIGNLTIFLLQGLLPTTVPSSTYDALACCGATYNLNLKAQNLWNIITDSTRNYYSRRYASIALGCLSNYSDIAQHFDNMTKASDRVKPYIQITLEHVAERNPVNFIANFTSRLANLQTKLGPVSVASLITRAGRKLNNNDTAAVLNSIIGDQKIDSVVRTAAENIVEAVKLRQTWLYKNQQALVSALQSHTLPSSGNILSAAICLLFLPFLLFMWSLLNVGL